MKRASHRMGFATALVVLLLLGGCTALVGDACESDTDCGQALRCDQSQPGGYCTVTSCTVNECPEEAACIQFQDDSRYCMLRCEESSDCRDGYVCVADFGDSAFCNATPLMTTTSR